MKNNKHRQRGQQQFQDGQPVHHRPNPNRPDPKRLKSQSTQHVKRGGRSTFWKVHAHGCLCKQALIAPLFIRDGLALEHAARVVLMLELTAMSPAKATGLNLRIVWILGHDAYSRIGLNRFPATANRGAMAVPIRR
jgi:hypothetical protein